MLSLLGFSQVLPFWGLLVHLEVLNTLLEVLLRRALLVREDPSFEPGGVRQGNTPERDLHLCANVLLQGAPRQVSRLPSLKSWLSEHRVEKSVVVIFSCVAERRFLLVFDMVYLFLCPCP